MGNNAATVSDGVTAAEESEAMLFSLDSIDRTSLCASVFVCVRVRCVVCCARYNVGEEYYGEP